MVAVSGLNCNLTVWYDNLNQGSCKLQPATGNLTVGLFGGSFNPAHCGHLHLSEFARKCLGLAQIWWMVSPKNPLKPQTEMAPFAQRMESARTIAGRNPHIRVMDIERKLNSRYTIDSLRKLKQHFPHIHFVWLMGADNLQQFHHWKQWRDIFATVPIAVFDRAPYSHSSLRQKAPLCYAKQRVLHPRCLALRKVEIPAWSFIHMPRHPASSTGIRSASA